MNINFITFGSHNNYIDAGKRLLKQASELNLFTQTILYTPDDLKKNIDFWDTHNNFINNNKRGYGYMLWKPFLIKKTMENMNEGDILLYLDCGCELDYQKKNNLINIFDIVKTNKLLYTITHIEKDWNKMDLIINLDMNKENDLNTQQRQTGAICFLVCAETINLVNEWYKIGSEYHNIDDSPSILKNLKGFCEHRHDQSIFSLLSKKYNFYNDNYSESVFNAINYSRNRTGISRINDINNSHSIDKKLGVSRIKYIYNSHSINKNNKKLRVLKKYKHVQSKLINNIKYSRNNLVKSKIKRINIKKNKVIIQNKKIFNMIKIIKIKK